MPTVLLLHTNQEYATSLADAIESVAVGYHVDVVSREPVRDRISHLLDHDYDLVQADELLVNGVLACGASLFPGTPFVVTIRGWADYTNAHSQYGWLRDATIQLRTTVVLQQASNVIFLSERTCKEFEQRYRVDNKNIISRPIDIDHYRRNTLQKNIATTDDSDFNLLTVTNLRYKEKFEGIKTILEGLRDSFERHDMFHYTVAGGGAYREPLERFLDDYPYSDQVTVLGYRDDIPSLLADSDAFVYVSYLDSLGTVVLEAQAAGLPVIAGNASGVPEAVGDAGVLCPPTPDGVSEAVERVVTDNEFRRELAARSREKMRTYNERCAKRHVAVWEDVLS